MINIFEPTLGEEELESLKKVFESRWLGKGPKTKEFEILFSNLLNVSSDKIISTNCCSEGLFSSLYICGIKPGDEVIVPTISFIGAGNAVMAHGAKMVFCDVDRRTLNATAKDIVKVITPKTKALLLLHYGGNAYAMEEIMEVVKKYNLILIEDSAAGVCSTYKGKALGTFGDMGMWSFDAMKVLVTGDGAMLYFNTPELCKKAEKYLYFGLESKSGYSNTVDQKWWEFDVSCFGHRAIMNDITAAIGIEQLKKLPVYMTKRKKVHEFYNINLSNLTWLDLPLELPENSTSTYYFYHIQVKGNYRDALAKHLRENGIYTTYRYYPLHRVKGYGLNEVDFPNADYAADHTLNLPIHQSLSEEDTKYIVEKIIEFGRINKLEGEI